MIRQLMHAALLLAVVSCKPGARAQDQAAAGQEQNRPVTLRLDRAEYGQGEQPRLTLINTGGWTYAYNPCTRVIEVNTDGAWTAAETGPRICTMEAWMLRPGDSVTAPIELPATLPAGQFRLRLAMTTEGVPPGEGHLLLVSPPFTVRR